MPYPKIEPEEIRITPLERRQSKSDIERIAIAPENIPPRDKSIDSVVQETTTRIKNARACGAAVILAFGAHLVKNGLAPVVLKLMQDGWVTHIATNGAGGIHDWEFAWLGSSEEDVRANVATGTFGAWAETGKYINLAVQVGALQGMGYGESLGALIEEEKLDVPEEHQLEAEIKTSLAIDNSYLAARSELLQTVRKFNLPAGLWRISHPFKKYSIFAGAYRFGLPLTVHPGIGYDIIYNNPYANGAALGRAAHTDYKIFVKSMTNLSHGVFLSIGSAIMAPQVFEKALSFANNLKLQLSESIIHNHFIVVNDLQQATWDWSAGEPPKEASDYYLRFLKSFYRMGGEVRYVAADNRAFLRQLVHNLEPNKGKHSQ
ncbi:hypothetical protein EH223_20530 [candidate division KSB1 bacterium]|nr:hypothetical protein [candidate division KSB1 bacterium]RQV99890.1 MAG: hypothetical protein EH223_20530 [candidate division KSB1 bacterium]